MRESKLQMSCVDYFLLQYENKGLGMICSIPNEGRRNAVTGGRLKRMGLKAGMPDIFILKKGSQQVLFIELKTTHWRSGLSEIQILTHKKLQLLGQLVFTIRTFDEFKLIVDKWFNRP